MKTKHRRNSLAELCRSIFRWRATRHDPLLSLSINLFNHTEELSRGFQGVITRGSRLMTDY
jgi:hypothetical protein